MAYYTHNTCKLVGNFKVEGIHVLAMRPCPQCGKTDWAWEPYQGLLATVMLKDEDNQHEQLKPRLDAAMDTYNLALKDEMAAAATRNQLQFQYEKRLKVSQDEAATVLEALDKANTSWAEATAALEAAAKKLKPLAERMSDLGNRAAVNKDAPKAYKAAMEVEDRSKKNKLYIGDRQHVSMHVRGKPTKAARILDVPNWSPGLNVSWVEGGIKAGAHFKLKLNANNPRGSIPDDVLQRLRNPAGISASDFYELCKSQGSGSLLWYDRDGAARPTWTAMEIWCLLRQGYTFNFLDSRKDGAGRKIVLMPPNG